MQIWDIIKEFFIGPKKKAHELEVGIPRPTFVLAGLIKQKMILNAPTMPDYEIKSNKGYTRDMLSRELVWVISNLKLAANSYTHGRNWLVSVYIDGRAVDLGKDEELIREAVKECLELRYKFVEAEKESSRQLAALDHTEKLLEISPSKRPTQRVLQKTATPPPEGEVLRAVDTSWRHTNTTETQREMVARNYFGY